MESVRFMITSLSKLADNLTERIYEINCKNCGWFFQYESVKNDLITYKGLSCSEEI